MTARRRNWFLILVVLLFIVVLRVFTGPERSSTRFFDTTLPQVIAHQGGNHLRPGNTLLALSHGRALGADVLEMDVHTAATGEIVVIHDATVDRTTNGSGAVAELSLDALKALDAAYHWPFEGDERPYRGKGVRIPTLDEVLTRFPGVPLNIEIKQDTPEMSEALCALLRAHGAEDMVLVASSLRSAMLDFRAACPEVATGAFALEVGVFMFHEKLALTGIYRPEAHALQVPEERYGVEMHTPDVIQAALERRLLVHAWTVNERAAMDRLFTAGVSGIITDRPDLAIAAREEYLASIAESR